MDSGFKAGEVQHQSQRQGDHKERNALTFLSWEGEQDDEPVSPQRTMLLSEDLESFPRTILRLKRTDHDVWDQSFSCIQDHICDGGQRQQAVGWDHGVTDRSLSQKGDISNVAIFLLFFISDVFFSRIQTCSGD